MKAGRQADLEAGCVGHAQRAGCAGGGCAQARLCCGTALAVAEKVQPPALIMVGQVVQLHPLLARPGTVLQTAQAAQEAKELASA